MKSIPILGAVAVAALIAALAYLVAETAAGQEDWIELATIAAATLLAGGGLFARRLPRSRPSPRIRRTP